MLCFAASDTSPSPTPYALDIYINFYGTEDPRYNNSVCYQRFGCKIEFAVTKKLDRTRLKHEKQILLNSFFYYKS